MVHFVKNQFIRLVFVLLKEVNVLIITAFQPNPEWTNNISDLMNEIERKSKLILIFLFVNTSFHLSNGCVYLVYYFLFFLVCHSLYSYSCISNKNTLSSIWNDSIGNCHSRMYQNINSLRMKRKRRSNFRWINSTCYCN